MSGDGAVVAVGAYADASNQIGSVSVYENQSGTWVQKGQTLVGLTSSRFGRSVALNATGSVLVAGGATWSSNRGFVRVYEYSGGNWVQIGADITGDASNHRTGWSVAINDAGTRIAISENLFDEGANTDIGRVRIFDNVSNVWTLAGTIVGEAAGDQFGQSVCLDASGNILAVGANLNDGSGSDAGHVKVFEYVSGTIWDQIGDIDGTAADDQFGWDVSLNAAGSRLAVSAPNAGTPYIKVYQNNSGTWGLLGGATDIVGVLGENTGRYSLDLNAAGDVVAVGGEGFTGGGRARVFEYNGTNWNLIAAQVLSEAAGDLWGYSIAISDDGSVFGRKCCC
jgi:hypothetical protein